MKSTTKVTLLGVAALTVLAAFLLGRSSPSHRARAFSSAPLPEQEGVANDPVTEVLPPPPSVSASAVTRVPPPPAASTKPSTRHAPGPSLLHSVPWGGGPGELGRAFGGVGPRNLGPESFTMGPDGEVLIADNINNRVARLARDGTPLPPLKGSAATAQVIAFRDGNMAVRDYPTATVAFYDPNGASIGALALERRAIYDDVFAAGNVLVVKTMAGYPSPDALVPSTYIRVGDSRGNAARPAQTLPGRPTHDGSAFIRLEIPSRSAGTYTVNVSDAEGHVAWQRAYHVDAKILAEVVGDDDAGRIYVTVGEHLPTAPEDQSISEIVCLDGRTGDELGRAPIDLSGGEAPPYVVWGLVHVTPDGTIVVGSYGREAMTLNAYHCP